MDVAEPVMLRRPEGLSDASGGEGQAVRGRRRGLGAVEDQADHRCTARNRDVLIRTAVNDVEDVRPSSPGQLGREAGGGGIVDVEVIVLQAGR